ncbi:MAG: hypothetical protein FWE82_03965 [Defluviitaleaceae bacterium]|nr:hypothetical protein [Defluviitaleaceae bacterium]
MAEPMGIVVFLCDEGFDGIVSEVPSACNNVLVMDSNGTDIIERMKAKRSELTRSMKTGIGVNVQNTVICLTGSLERVPFFIEQFETVKSRWNTTTMDIVVVSGEILAKKAETAINAIIGVFGLCVFYLRHDELSNGDIQGICANLVENRLRRANLSDGFYLIRAAVGSMGEFNLFYELSSRRLEEAGKKGSLGAGADEVTEFIKNFTDKNFTKIREEAFRYLIWDKPFDRGFTPAGQYRDNQPFVESVKNFIQLNASVRFHQEMAKLKENEGQLYDLFFENFSNNVNEAIGEARIVIMGEALDLLRHSKSQIIMEQGGVLVDTGTKPNGYESEDIWAYNSYMYKNFFSRKLDAERYDCELMLIEAIFDEIDRAAAREREHLDEFYAKLREKRDSENAFTQALYEKINLLYKSNPEAERYLLKTIREYISTFRYADDETAVSRALFAPTAARFGALLNDPVSKAFINDTAEQLRTRFNQAAEELLSEPHLLIEGFSFSLVQHSLGMSDPMLRSFKSFGGYSTSVSKALDNNENIAIVYMYHQINISEPTITEMLYKII